MSDGARVIAVERLREFIWQQREMAKRGQEDMIDGDDCAIARWTMAEMIADDLDALIASVPPAEPLPEAVAPSAPDIVLFNSLRAQLRALEEEKKRVAVAERDEARAQLREAQAAIENIEHDSRWRHRWHDRLGRGNDTEGKFYERLEATREEAESQLAALLGSIRAMRNNYDSRSMVGKDLDIILQAHQESSA
jgi:hypothetical protein